MADGSSSGERDMHAWLREIEDARRVWRRGQWRISPDTTVSAFVAKVPFRELPRAGWIVKILPALLLGVLNQIFLRFFPGRQGSRALIPGGASPARPALTGVPDAESSDAQRGGLVSARRTGLLKLYSVLEASIVLTVDDEHGGEAHAPELPTSHRPVERVDAYLDVFRALPTPRIAETWTEPHGGLSDELFAWLRVAGPNPEVIERVDAVPDGFPAGLMDQAGDGLFLADYSALGALSAGTWKGLPRWVGAPRALFGVRGGELVPLAIVREAGGPVTRPGDPGWLRAKHAVQVADMNHHELCTHLALTHLLCELFLLATRHELPARHPVARLLIPHFEGTLFINHLARTSLIADRGPIDQILGGTIESSRALSAASLARLDFDAYDLPTRTARRRTDAIGVYPFRDDALRVWRAIESFVRAYVWRWYASDEAVADDAFLHAWGATLSLAPTEGGVAGFVAPQDREALTRVLTLVVYTASAQHAAVNFPQFPLMSFAPLMSGAGWSDTPGAVDERGGIAAFLPPRPVARQQAELLHLLSSVCYAPLGGFDEGWFDDRAVREMVEGFQRELRSLDDEIDRENDARRWPYPYLRPSRVPRSVNI